MIQSSYYDVSQNKTFEWYVDFYQKYQIDLCNLALYLCHLVSAELQPVNRFFTAENVEPQPDLECLVGVHSASTSEMYRVKCNDSWNITVKYDRKKANSLAADRYISEHDRRLRIIRLASTL